MHQIYLFVISVYKKSHQKMKFWDNQKFSSSSNEILTNISQKFYIILSFFFVQNYLSFKYLWIRRVQRKSVHFKFKNFFKLPRSLKM